MGFRRECNCKLPTANCKLQTEVKIAIAYPPLESDKGVPLLSQNRQFQWFSRPTYIFPVVPAAAATMLKGAGHEVVWMDGIAEELSTAQYIERLREETPDVVVMETKTPVVKRHWEWAKIIKRELGDRTAVILAGDHVTAMPEETMANSPADFILTGGDWDFLLRGLVENELNAANCQAGIYYRDGGVVKSTGRFRNDHDLRELPHIDRELCRWELYAVKNGNFRRTPGTYIMSGRDCWHGRCTFCSWTTLYPQYRTRDVMDVVDEIGELIERYGVKEIMDDTGSFPAGQWLDDFCHEMIRRGYNKRVRIDCNMRFGRLGAADYKLMRKAGFRLVLFGVESANQATLDRLCKALKVEDVEKGAEAASKAGLDVHLTFMFGYPWEGEAEIQNTVKLARRMLAKGFASTLQCTIAIPYPGTPLFRELEASGQLETLDWDDYDMRRAVMKTPLVPDGRVQRAVQEVYRGFLQPRALWHRLTDTRTLFDFAFYWRGIRSLFGHLNDFKKQEKQT